MAHRAFPAILTRFVTSNSVIPYLLDDDHETIDGSAQVIARSAGRWQGSLVLAACGVNDRDRLLETRAFIQSLQGRRHTFDCPLFSEAPQPMLKSGQAEDLAAVTLASPVVVSSGQAVLDLSGVTANHGIRRGTFVSVNGLGYSINTEVSLGTYNAVPARPGGAAGDLVLFRAPVFVKARVAPEGIVNASVSPAASGPWIVNWRSEVD